MATSGRIADQIQSAVQDAVSSQDFSNLASTIESSIDAAAKGIGRGVAQAHDSYARAQQNNQRARMQEQRRNLERQQHLQYEQQMLAVYAKPSQGSASGVVQTVVGAMLLVLSFPFLLISLVDESLVGAVSTGMFLLVGAGLLVSGARSLSLSSRFRTYRNYIGLRDYCTVEELSRATGEDCKKVLGNIKRMLKKGLFRQAALDRGETTLIMNRQSYAYYEESESQYQRRLQEQEMARSVTPDTRSGKAMTDDAAALISRGEAYVAKIRLSNEAIPGAEISRKIDQIENVVRLILKRAQEHPEVIDDLGQLMDYYLPLTVKLLDAYRDLDSQPIQGENIVKSKREIEGALDSLAVAFEKLLDQVFKDVAWDVSSDVSVLHTILAQEGLVEDPFAPKGVTTR